MKEGFIKSIAGGKNAYSIAKDGLSGGTDDFYNFALPELWALKVKARRRMGLDPVNHFSLAANQ